MTKVSFSKKANLQHFEKNCKQINNHKKYWGFQDWHLSNNMYFVKKLYILS